MLEICVNKTQNEMNLTTQNIVVSSPKGIHNKLFMVGGYRTLNTLMIGYL